MKKVEGQWDDNGTDRAHMDDGVEGEAALAVGGGITTQLGCQAVTHFMDHDGEKEGIERKDGGKDFKQIRRSNAERIPDDHDNGHDKPNELKIFIFHQWSGLFAGESFFVR